MITHRVCIAEDATSQPRFLTPKYAPSRPAMKPPRMKQESERATALLVSGRVWFFGLHR